MSTSFALELQSPTLAGSANRADGILVFAAEPAASAVADCLQKGLSLEVHTVAGMSQCRDVLQRKRVALIVLEENVAATNPEEVKQMYAASGGAWVLEVNFGCSNAERILKQACAALHRRAENVEQAAVAATDLFRSQLTSSLSGLLLESQIALQRAGPELAPALKRIVGMAEQVLEQLQGTGTQVVQTGSSEICITVEAVG